MNLISLDELLPKSPVVWPWRSLLPAKGFCIYQGDTSSQVEGEGWHGEIQLLADLEGDFTLIELCRPEDFQAARLRAAALVSAWNASKCALQCQRVFVVAELNQQDIERSLLTFRAIVESKKALQP